MLEWDIIMSEFELQSRNYVQPLGKVWTSLFPPAIGYIVPLMSFYKDAFGIKQPRNVNRPLNKENEPYI